MEWMPNSYFTNIHTRKLITENVIFHNLSMSKLYNKKNHVEVNKGKTKLKHD